MNTHFISRFLTKPWEHGQRQLTLLDVDARTLLPPRSSKRLFAKEGLFSADMETWFDRMFEDRVSKWREQMVRGERPEPDWRLYRAMIAAVLWAGPRVAAARDALGGAPLDPLLATPVDESTLDSLVAVHARSWRLVAVPTLSAVPLFFPDTALFGMLLGSGRERLGVAFFVPVDPTLALGLIPRAIDPDLLPNAGIRPGALQSASFGHPSRCRRLVVPPSVRDLGAPSLVEVATAAREITRDQFANYERLRTVDRELRAIRGSVLERGGVNRGQP